MRQQTLWRGARACGSSGSPCSPLVSRASVSSQSSSRVKVSPWQCPSLAPTPLRGAPGGSGRLVTPRERPHHWPSSHCLGCSSKPPPKPAISPPLTIQAQTAGPGRWVCSYAGELLNLSQLLTRYAASKPTYVYRLSGSLSTGCSKLAPGADLIPRFPCAEGTCRGYLRRPRRSPWPPVNTRGMFRLAPSPATLLRCCTQALDRRTGHRSLLSLPQPPRAPQPTRKGRPHQNEASPWPTPHPKPPRPDPKP